MHARLHAAITRLSIAALAFGAGVAGGEPREIWLRQGADVSASKAADGERIVFGLVGRIWAMNPIDGFATQLSDDDELARRPVLSPDGSLVAYETIRDGFHHIMVRDADGSMPRRVTFGDINHRSPSWSPPDAAQDTGRLIMSSDRGGRYGIWEVDVDTLNLRQLTFAGTNEREPAWDATGTRIAYVADTDRGTAIFAVTPGDKPELLLEERANIRAPSWRPGGGLLTYVRELDGKRQLRMLILSQPAITKPITRSEDAFPYPAHWFDRSRYMYTADGHIRTRTFGERHFEPVAFNALLEIEPAAWARTPPPLEEAANQPVRGDNGRSVAPDGRYVIATLGDLWEIGPDNTLLRQLTNDPFVDAHPALSPDGTRLAFVSDRGGSLQIWLLELDTMRTRRLTREFGVALYPTWTDDGAAIEYRTAPHVAAREQTSKTVDIAAASDAGVSAETERTEPRAATESPVQTDIPLTWRPQVTEGRKIVRAGRIFDGLGPGYLHDHEIVIDGDRITAVRPWSAEEDGGTEIVDARELTVIPGLVDMAVRQSPVGDERLGRKYLAYGVTTIRESISNPAEAIERRESWRSGRRIGPRLLMTGTPCADSPGGLGARPVLEPAVAQRSFRNRINEAIERGSVAIGICPSLNTGTRVDLIVTVHARGLPVIARDAFPDILLGADEARLSPLAVYDDFAAVTGTLGTTVTSNLATEGLPLLIQQGDFTTGWQYTQLFTRAEQTWYGAQWKRATAAPDELRVRTRTAGDGLSAAVARGARVVAGSDTPRVPPGLGLHAELRLLVAAGLQPFQALRMATLDAGRAVGAPDSMGRIVPGAYADLVIIDGDPLQDIRAAARVTMTIVGGRPYTRRTLSSRGHRPASVGKLYN